MNRAGDVAIAGVGLALTSPVIGLAALDNARRLARRAPMPIATTARTMPPISIASEITAISGPNRRSESQPIANAATTLARAPRDRPAAIRNNSIYFNVYLKSRCQGIGKRSLLSL